MARDPAAGEFDLLGRDVELRGGDARKLVASAVSAARCAAPPTAAAKRLE